MHKCTPKDAQSIILSQLAVTRTYYAGQQVTWKKFFRSNNP